MKTENYLCLFMVFTGYFRLMFDEYNGENVSKYILYPVALNFLLFSDQVMYCQVLAVSLKWRKCLKKPFGINYM